MTIYSIGVVKSLGWGQTIPDVPLTHCVSLLSSLTSFSLRVLTSKEHVVMSASQGYIGLQ